MKKLALVLLVSSFGVAYAADSPAAGKWAVHSSIAGNESDQTCTFAQTGKVLSGTCVNDDKTSVKITGTVEGAKVTWTYHTDYNGTDLTIKYSGTLAEGKITGDANVDPFGVSGDFTAKVVKP